MNEQKNKKNTTQKVKPALTSSHPKNQPGSGGEPGTPKPVPWLFRLIVCSIIALIIAGLIIGRNMAVTPPPADQGLSGEATRLTQAGSIPARTLMAETNLLEDLI